MALSFVSGVIIAACLTSQSRLAALWLCQISLTPWKRLHTPEPGGRCKCFASKRIPYEAFDALKGLPPVIGIL